MSRFLKVPKDRPLSDEDRQALYEEAQYHVIEEMDRIFPADSDSSSPEPDSDDDEQVEVTKEGLHKLKVDELRAELEGLNLPTDGVKDELVDRLFEALTEPE